MSYGNKVINVVNSLLSAKNQSVNEFVDRHGQASVLVRVIVTKTEGKTVYSARVKVSSGKYNVDIMTATVMDDNKPCDMVICDKGEPAYSIPPPELAGSTSPAKRGRKSRTLVETLAGVEFNPPVAASGNADTDNQ